MNKNFLVVPTTIGMKNITIEEAKVIMTKLDTEFKVLEYYEGMYEAFDGTLIKEKTFLVETTIYAHELCVEFDQECILQIKKNQQAMLVDKEGVVIMRSSKKIAFDQEEMVQNVKRYKGASRIVGTDKCFSYCMEMV